MFLFLPTNPVKKAKTNNALVCQCFPTSPFVPIEDVNHKNIVIKKGFS